MKNYEVTVKAVITKTFYIEAPSQEEAETVAHELFNPYSGEAEEKYEQETIKIEHIS